MENKNMKTRVELIAEERQRQVEEEGWTSEHDKWWRNGELCRADVCYIKRPDWLDPTLWQEWPFELSWWKPTPQDRIRELQKAGALIAAEIDRLLNS